MHSLNKTNSLPQSEQVLLFGVKSISLPIQWRLLTAALVGSDIFLSLFALRLAYSLRFELALPIFRLEVTPIPQYYEQLSFFFAGLLILLFVFRGLYQRENLLGGTKEYALIFSSTTSGLLIVIIIGFLNPEFVLARGWLFLAWFFTFFNIAVGRFILRRIVYRLRRLGYFLFPAVIVGANDEGIELANQLVDWTTSGFHIVGFVDNLLNKGAHATNNLICLGTTDDLPEVVKKYNIQEIILATSARSAQANLLSIFKEFGVRDNLRVRFSSGLYEAITTGLTIKNISYVPLVTVDPVRLTGADRILKAALDYGLVIPGLFLISPLLALIAIVVRFDSPGPVIYRRRVMGVRGRQFDAFKFRTMHQNGDQILAHYPELQTELAENHKLQDDPRITRVGKILRKLSLDELPQLFNVLRGEMSLVGPRMISPAEIEKYEQWDVNLLTVRPGISGLWQVSGRSDISYEERVKLDMHYIRNWSIWLDLQILTQTIPAVIRGRGAY